jgi:hypothetical protein
MGGEVHSSYYLSNNGPVAKDYMKETMSIGAGGKKKFKYKVDVPLSVLRYILSLRCSLVSLWTDIISLDGSLWRREVTSDSESIPRIPKVALTTLFHSVELTVTWLWKRGIWRAKNLESVSFSPHFFLPHIALVETHPISYINRLSDVLEFDNAFSYLRSKKLRYFIAIDPPSSELIGEQVKWIAYIYQIIFQISLTQM